MSLACASFASLGIQVLCFGFGKQKISGNNKNSVKLKYSDLECEPHVAWVDMTGVKQVIYVT